MKDSSSFQNSRNSADSYFLWRKQRSLSAIKRVDSIRSIKRLEILDVGCGYGSLMSNLLEKGANVTGVEVDQISFEFAKKFLKKDSKAKIVLVKDERLPFKKNSFDIIFLFDVIEHVNNPSLTMNECYRVLKPGGIIYIEFTPYYSIVGHHLYDFAKWPIHILPEKYIKKVVYTKKIKTFCSPDHLWGVFKSLNKIKISEFQKLAQKFTTIEEKFVIKYPGLFEVNIPLLNFLGPFKDFLTFSFQGIYRKDTE
ncbi:MAG: class I SAM-dependent methyltransferase [Candidatus Levybacteria bacterium]|nr:class I SAM-dependent methyltransferase [Candidatus Levybacteria bacterium]